MTDPQDTPLNSLVGRLAQVVGSDFAEATDHPYACRCDICLVWWVKMGDDENQPFNSFTRLEIEAARTASEENNEETETD